MHPVAVRAVHDVHAALGDLPIVGVGGVASADQAIEFLLAGAAAVDPSPGPAALGLALTLFFWTPPHFWSLAYVYKDEYARAGVPMLPVVAGEKTAARIVLAQRRGEGAGR